MKKVLLVATMIMLAMCIFTIFTSAEAYTYDFGEVEKIDFFENDADYLSTVIGSSYIKPTTKDARCVISCTCEKGKHTYPTYYIMQEKKSDWQDLFRKDFKNLNANNPCGATYDMNSLLAIEVPEGIGDFWGQTNTAGAFMNHKNVVYISIPSTMDNMHVNPFRGCTSLEWVDFSKNNKLTTLDDSAFNGCTSLKGVCLPDSIKTMNNATFIGCTNLGPVYLPASLTKFGTSMQWNTFQGGENGNGAKCTKLFLTNEKFDNPDEVVKPTVYYMPSKFASCGDQLFRGCTNINDVIVFPATYTSVADARSFLGYGATAENPKTIVFLGDMTSFSTWIDSSSSYMNYVFANANDTTGGFTCSFTSSGATAVKLYSCASEKVCAPNGEWTTDGFTHFANPNTFVEVSPATCLLNQKTSANCFCGDSMGTIEVDNTALGHNHSVFADLAYANYLEDGVYIYKCERCDDLKNGESAPALFKCLGYSVPEDGRGEISIGYIVNSEAIKEYTSKSGVTLKYGVFAVLEKNIGDGNIFDASGNPTSNVVKAEIDAKYGSFELKISGFENEYKSIKLAMGAYVEATEDNDTVCSFMQEGTPLDGAKFVLVSYNDVINGTKED